MSRVLILIVSVVVFAGAAGAVLITGTGPQLERARADAEARLKATGPKVVLAAESHERTLLDDAREAALGLGVGQALERLNGEAKPAKKKAKPAPEVIVPVEQAAELLKEVDEALKETLEGKRWAAVFDKRGRAVVSTGDGYKLGTTLKYGGEVGAALEGVSQLSAVTIGKQRHFIAVAPTIGAGGFVNGAVVIGETIDASLCTTLALKSGVSSLALFDASTLLCATAGLDLAGVPQQDMVKPGPLEGGATLLMADPASIGLLVTKLETTLPVLGSSIVLAEDMRPRMLAVAEWQQMTLMSIGLLFVVSVLLLLIGMLLAARPADAIANHLALIHQGGKVPALSERKFSGGFKRIVKNLNTLLEKREARSIPGASLQPISQLLAGSPDPAEQDMRFETADTGTIGGKAKTQTPPPPPPEPDAPKSVTLSPMVQPARPEPKPVLSPLSPATFDMMPKSTPPPPPAALNALFDDKTPMLDEDKTAISRPPPPPSDARDDRVSALPPLPDMAALGTAPMSQGIKSVSSSEADSALGDLNAVPSGNAPLDTPWDTSKPGGGNGEIDEDHYHQVFEEFLKVRAQCGEPTTNLTFDKFVEKLKKSRDQVMQKQNTKSVRFQVYVKDGKAALKAVAAK
ncbi:MAG: hypothetical protein IT381_16645 [Deltaproteobacteria bacterium]|nr:hypothetical protein [Deltaproteobacteria bacterium]